MKGSTPGSYRVLRNLWKLNLVCWFGFKLKPIFADTNFWLCQIETKGLKVKNPCPGVSLRAPWVFIPPPIDSEKPMVYVLVSSVINMPLSRPRTYTSYVWTRAEAVKKRSSSHVHKTSEFNIKLEKKFERLFSPRRFCSRKRDLVDPDLLTIFKIELSKSLCGGKGLWWEDAEQTNLSEDFGKKNFRQKNVPKDKEVGVEI